MTWKMLKEYEWYCRKKGRVATIYGLKAYANERRGHDWV